MGRERYSEEQQAFYRAYINGLQWKARRAARIAKAGRRCEFVLDDFLSMPQRCPRARYLCVHHLTYERLGAERDGDLAVLCWPHHMLEHLLWKGCKECGIPCLVDDASAHLWLVAVLASMCIDVDVGPINWKRLPNKEVLLAQVPDCCPSCLRFEPQ